MWFQNITIKFKCHTLKLFLFLKRTNLGHLEIKILKLTLLIFDGLVFVITIGVSKV